MSQLGHSMIFSPDPIIEYDTITCGHCQKVTILESAISLDSILKFCIKCKKYVCIECLEECR